MSADPMNIYFTKWLPRARRLLAPSGRLTELAHTLSAKDQIPAEDWRTRLRRVLDGHEQPDTDLVFEVERFVARPIPERNVEQTKEFGLAN
ncbi:MAG: hypothetical protein ACSHYB_14500 [Roseibacillus sp.]